MSNRLRANAVALAGLFGHLESITVGLEDTDAEGVFWGACLDTLDANCGRARRATDALEREGITLCTRAEAVRRHRLELRRDAESEWPRGASSVFDTFIEIRPSTMPAGLGVLHEISNAIIGRLVWSADHAECRGDLASAFELCARQAGILAAAACRGARAAALASKTKTDLYELVYSAFDIAHLLRWCRRDETTAAITAARLELAGYCGP